MAASGYNTSIKDSPPAMLFVVVMVGLWTSMIHGFLTLLPHESLFMSHVHTIFAILGGNRQAAVEERRGGSAFLTCLTG